MDESLYRPGRSEDDMLLLTYWVARKVDADGVKKPEVGLRLEINEQVYRESDIPW